MPGIAAAIGNRRGFQEKHSCAGLGRLEGSGHTGDTGSISSHENTGLIGLHVFVELRYPSANHWGVNMTAAEHTRCPVGRNKAIPDTDRINIETFHLTGDGAAAGIHFSQKSLFHFLASLNSLQHMGLQYLNTGALETI